MAPDLTPDQNADNQLQHAEIEVHGIVQDVNFRMTFKRIAFRLKLRGEIWNDIEDEDLVHIRVEGTKRKIDEFVRNIEEYKIQPQHDGEMSPFFSLIQVDTIKVDRVNISDYRLEKETFKILRPELEDAKRVDIEILKKISTGGVVYQQFHNDHNRNFHILENKFGSVSEGIGEANVSIKELGGGIERANDSIDSLGGGIEQANKSIDSFGDHLTTVVSDLVKWMKIGIFTLVGTGVAYIIVRVSIG